ncbi:MAG: DUF3127 domain-containing protein [Thermoflexibacteraceae bacterium]|jgi:single-strand DNA-binding protein
MSTFQTKGKLHVKYDTQQVTEKFKKREFVLEIQESQYPEYIKFQLTQDKCSLLDKYQQGDVINVHFNLKGKPFQSKTGEMVYYTNLDVWRIDTQADAAPTNTANYATAPSSMPNDVPLPTDADDLPF